MIICSQQPDLNKHYLRQLQQVNPLGRDHKGLECFHKGVGLARLYWEMEEGQILIFLCQVGEVEVVELVVGVSHCFGRGSQSFVSLFGLPLS